MRTIYTTAPVDYDYAATRSVPIDPQIEAMLYDCHYDHTPTFGGVLRAVESSVPGQAMRYASGLHFTNYETEIIDTWDYSQRQAMRRRMM